MKKLKDLLNESMAACPDILEYQMKENLIYFHCSGLDEDDCGNKNNRAVGELFNAFLLELSEGKKVFFQGYRFFGEETKVVDPGVILEKAEILLNPSLIFLELKSAKIDSLEFHRGCEGGIYYFDSKVEWTDFLASSPVHHPEKLIEKGLLSAVFSFGEFGIDFYFWCSRTYESRVLQLFEELAASGYEVKRCMVRNKRRL